MRADGFKLHHCWSGMQLGCFCALAGAGGSTSRVCRGKVMSLSVAVGSGICRLRDFPRFDKNAQDVGGGVKLREACRSKILIRNKH